MPSTLSNTITTPTPSPAPGSPYTCPSSDTVASVSRGSSANPASLPRRTYRRAANVAAAAPLLAVSYRTSAITNPAASIDARIASLGAAKQLEFDYPTTGVATRLLHVAPSQMAQAESALRSTPGVVAVGATRRVSALSVNGPYFGNDPYFVGPPGSVAPLYQTDTTGGQWDMHIVQLEHAFDYSVASNGSGVSSAGALGSANVRLAIIDTGEDVTHPELKLAHVVRTECFITNESNVQSTGTFVTDGWGHGTDVTGIAAASPNNDFAFTGAGGGVSLMLYRVFPTPDDSCTNDQSSDDQCGADDVDVVSAIDDAVANGANVISMSLGGGISDSDPAGCTSPGVDFDPAEGNAIANAIAHNVIVVAASGNAGGSGVAAPACDAGVIAVGASGYYDGHTNATGYVGSIGSEYVTGYSQYGSVNVGGSATSWGIVAPGGDALNSNDEYNLHWIENIWTSTPYMSSSTDTSFEGACNNDEFNEVGNCRTLVDGTSMATPHVAGAAALILSAAPSYATPTAMRQLLCSTADNIGSPNEGCGRLNVYRAMAQALSDPSPPT